MKKFLIVILFVFFCFDANAVVWNKPYRRADADRMNIAGYSWLTKQKNMLFSVHFNGKAKQFMSEDELFRYFKLKMRNFVKEITVVGKFGKDGKNFNTWANLNLDLYRYNEKTKIYYGFLFLEINPFLFDGDKYQIVVAIAGSDEQIVDEIKSYVDWMVETHADDYYYMCDLVRKDNKDSKKKKKVKK